MKKTVSAIIFLASALAVQAAVREGVDLSNRCSVVNKRVIASWEEGDCGFRPVLPGAATTNVDRVVGWSTLPFEGRCAMQVSVPDGIAADTPQTVHRTFDTPLDLRSTPVAEYGILVSEAPGRDFTTTLTLCARDGHRFASTTHIIPTLWRSAIFDVSACPFLGEVAAIEISVANESSEPWHGGYWMVDGFAFGEPLDLDFRVPGSEKRFTATGTGRIGRTGDALTFDFRPGDVLKVEMDTSRNSICNPPLERRNTVVLTIDNRSTATSLRLGFTTKESPEPSPEKAKTVEIPSGKGPVKVLVNLSDNKYAVGHLRTLKIEPLGGSGRLVVDRIAFERETPIAPSAGRIVSCRANGRTLEIKGIIDDKYLATGCNIEIRHAPLWKDELPFDSLELIAVKPGTRRFEFPDIPNRRLDGRMTHLSTRFKAGHRSDQGKFTPIGEAFYVENWRDFAENPYEFSLPDNRLYVTDFGARGDGIANDNAAIQRAIDRCSAAGGGSVVLPGAKAPEREREYLATNLEMRSGVNLVIEPGAVLRQSPDFSHYTSYRPEYGHDNIIPGVPWTHCMYTNMPLILAKDVERVKVTGGGRIRMDDTFSENPTWNHYARTCSDRIHIVPIAVCNVKHVEISDIDINRCSNYHTIFYRADSVFIGNLKMLEVACLSGDGLSFGNAVTNVRVERCFFESNDDGIVLASSYKDPRGGGWRVRVDSIDSSVRNIGVFRSYIDCARGGGGKAIAFIPWGSTNPRQDYNQIDGIEVRDCVLRGGNSVGAWADNPFDGKPFDNCEKDDYAPVQNVRIFDNEYLSNCYLFGVEPTTFLTDCGLHGSSTFKNAAFTDRLAYWQSAGDVEASPGAVALRGGSVSQGLYLPRGDYRLEWDADGKVTPSLMHYAGTPLRVRADNTFTIGDEDTYIIAFRSKDALLKAVRLVRID